MQEATTQHFLIRRKGILPLKGQAMDRGQFSRKIKVAGKDYRIYNIFALEEKGLAEIGRLPFSIRVLLENLLRHLDEKIVSRHNLEALASWRKSYEQPVEIPYHPARVLMQDFTGVPAVVDLAAMRDAMVSLGGDPSKINPLVPVDLIVDHSVQVDFFGTAYCLEKNVEQEYARNLERYQVLKWAQKSFTNFKVIPPNSGICHQVNLEHLGRVICLGNEDGLPLAFPDTLVGTDSHTPMINAIGVMGWGVGGIEAEAVMLGQPYYMAIPEVIGVRLKGHLPPGATATDLVLSITELLRKHSVVEKFVEFLGPGLAELSIPDRATISNMTPEYGATLGFFPVDEKTLAYLAMTGRGDMVDLVRQCTSSMGLFYQPGDEPEYTKVIDFDLGTVKPCLAGPSRPQDRIELANLKAAFAASLGQKGVLPEHLGGGTRQERCTPVSNRSHEVEINGRCEKLGDGNVVIAAITSCTNTSNPGVLVGAGLIAQKAVKLGLNVPAFVKTSFAPGSRVVLDYLQDAGLMPYFEALGFHPVAFGCTTCIGNSGPLHPEVEQVIVADNLNVAAVLSGNRNFEARIHQLVKSNFLTSPMLVVIFALAGRIDIDLASEPVGIDSNGKPVYLEDLWPEDRQVEQLVAKHVKRDFFISRYSRILEGDKFWKALQTEENTTYKWNPESTYIKKPPFFEGLKLESPVPGDIKSARALLVLGDSVTTDHISPAGAIPEDYPAGRYLVDKGLEASNFNSYGSRRGNHEVMMRGTFGNIRIKNRLVAPKEGSFTRKFPENKEMFIYDAAVAYKEQNVPLIVLAGKEYGTGSSRDWAAKGTNLLGIRAVIAESYERIHRNNLVGMGVLPLMFLPGQGINQLGLEGNESFSIIGLADLKPGITVDVKASKPDGRRVEFKARVRLDTQIEVDYYLNGGILPYVLRKLALS